MSAAYNTGSWQKGLCDKSQRSLSTEVEIRFGLVLLMACLIAGLMTTILERKTVDLMVEDMSEATKSSELLSIGTRIDKLSLAASSLFGQAANDVMSAASYAEAVLKGASADGMTLGYSSAYTSYSYVGPAPPGVDSARTTTDSFGYEYKTSYAVSGWWNKLNSVVTNEPYMPAANVLDNSFVSLGNSNANYGEVYMGFESGMMKKFPWYTTHAPGSCLVSGQAYKKGYACMQYTCLPAGATTTGYDPRCRGWYNLAKNSQSSVVFSDPYIGASKGYAMITIAKAVILEDNLSQTAFKGAIGIDIYIQTLKDSILSATVLEDGYTFMCDKGLNIIMHPNTPDNERLYTVQELEFPGSAANDLTPTMQTSITAGSQGTLWFQKSGSSWYASWVPVTGTNYYLVMVVPESNLLLAATNIEEDGAVAMGHLTGWVIGIGILSFLAGLMASKFISKKVTQPVDQFTQVIEEINDNKMGDADHSGMSPSEFKQINKLQSRILSLFLAVKFSTGAYHNNDFDAALKYLEVVQEMFADMKQQHALGVVLNNKAEILRAGIETEGKDPDSSHTEKELFAEANKCFRLAIANGHLLYRNAKLDLEAGEGELNMDLPNDQKQMDQLVANVKSYAKRYADRLSNYGVCLNGSGEYYEAMEQFTLAVDMYAEWDDMLGQIRVLGNKGLVHSSQAVVQDGNVNTADQELFMEASRCFEDAYNQALRSYTHKPTKNTLQAFQLASCNVGRHIKNMLNKNFYFRDADKKKAVTDCLKHFYYAITISPKIEKHVLARCVRSVAEVYEKYFFGDAKTSALNKLNLMFPKIMEGSERPKVCILVDVSPSMNMNDRIGSATSTLQSILNDQMRDGDVICIDHFATKHHRIVEFTALSRTNRAEIANAIYALNFNCREGTTHFYKALMELGQHATQSKSSAKEKVIVFALTDGEDNEHRTKISDVKDYYEQNNIKLMVITIGIGSSTKAKLLTLVENENYLIAASDDKSSIQAAMKTGYDFAQSSGAVVMETL